MAQFTQQSKINSSYFHSQSKTITEQNQYPFESPFKDGHNVFMKDVLSGVLPEADTQTEIDNWISSNPGIIKKYEQVDLTEISGSNGQAWQLIDSVDGVVLPFIDPVDVPKINDKTPSIGYTPILYDSTGTQLPTTAGSYKIKPFSGIVQFEVGYTPQDLGWGTPKLTVYGFIGNTLQDIIDSLVSTPVSYDEIIINIDSLNKTQFEFPLSNTPLNGSVWVIINGVIQTPLQDYTVDYGTPKISLTGDCVERFESDVIYIKYTY